MLDYYGRYGTVPASHTFKSEFPTYRLVKPHEPVVYYLDQVTHARKRKLVYDGLVKARDQLAEDAVDPALSALDELVVQARLESTGFEDVNLTANWEERLRGYAEMQAHPGLRGISTGFPTLDNLTGGLLSEQFVVVVGLPKGGKSIILMLMARAAHLYGKAPLFISFEMSRAEQELRYDSLLARANPSLIQNGRLSDEQSKRLRTEMRRSQNLPPFHLSTDVASATTPSGLLGKIEQVKPDIVFVDGLYLMQSEINAEPGSPQALTSITRSLKRIAQRTGIPVVGSTQVLPSKFSSRRGITMDSIGYSSSFVQDADLVLGIEHDSEDPTTAYLRVVAARNISPTRLDLYWEWETSTFEEV